MASSTNYNPVFMFGNILSQIEVHDSLIEFMTNILKYVTKIGLDIMAHCIVCSFENKRYEPGA